MATSSDVQRAESWAVSTAADWAVMTAASSVVEMGDETVAWSVVPTAIDWAVS